MLEGLESDVTLGLQLEVERTFRYRTANLFVHTNRAEDLSDFTLYPPIATTLDTSSGSDPAQLEMPGTPNAHRNRSGDQLRDTSQDDKF